MENSYFKLYSFCLPVMGKSAALIINMQRMTCTTIPQFLCEVLQDYTDVDILTLKNIYNDEENAIDEYFGFLIKNQLGFYTHEPERYPRMSLEWDAPEKIKAGRAADSRLQPVQLPGYSDAA